MLKCVLFLLSEYYYGIVEERAGEIYAKLNPHKVKMVLEKDLGGFFETDEINLEDTLIIADGSERIQSLLDKGKYVVILYHEKNRGQYFPMARYGVEDVFMLEYRSYEEAYKRLAGLPWNIFETDRLKVRESTVEDVDEFYRIYRDPSITLYMEDLYKDREAERAYMRAYIDQIYGFYGYGLWTVLLKETGQVIGRAGLSVREGYELPELGFVIEAACQHRGYGFEVCSGVLDYAEKELAFEQVQALVKEKNINSLQLLNKLGFAYNHNVMVKDHEYKMYIKNL
ncbi:MAG: GNAT family N-acetyltransferase [Lachnospiraceae bacterium]|nr:GNAT family N-acetyltransferase [Lachnospiraceae bacterium]